MNRRPYASWLNGEITTPHEPTPMISEHLQPNLRQLSFVSTTDPVYRWAT